MLSTSSAAKLGGAGALALLTLLAAAPRTAAAMYLRVASMKAAPVVATLSYDAVATVPARPNTLASLLPVDQVEGQLVLSGPVPAGLDRTLLKSMPSFTVVQLGANGEVVQRTTFHGVSSVKVEPVRTDDGMGRRVDFDAASVQVSVVRATT